MAFTNIYLNIYQSIHLPNVDFCVPSRSCRLELGNTNEAHTKTSTLMMMLVSKSQEIPEKLKQPHLLTTVHTLTIIF